MKHINLLRDKNLLLRQAVIAWTTLFLGVILFVVTALLTSIFTANKETSISIALLTSAAIMTLIQIVNHQNNYYIKLKNERIEDLLLSALITPIRSIWFAILVTLVTLLTIVIFSVNWILLSILLALFLLSLSLITIQFELETFGMITLIISIILLSPVLAPLSLISRLVTLLIFLFLFLFDRERRKKKVGN